MMNVLPYIGGRNGRFDAASIKPILDAKNKFNQVYAPYRDIINTIAFVLANTKNTKLKNGVLEIDPEELVAALDNGQGISEDYDKGLTRIHMERAFDALHWKSSDEYMIQVDMAKVMDVMNSNKEQLLKQSETYKHAVKEFKTNYRPASEAKLEVNPDAVSHEKKLRPSQKQKEIEADDARAIAEGKKTLFGVASEKADTKMKNVPAGQQWLADFVNVFQESIVSGLYADSRFIKENNELNASNLHGLYKDNAQKEILASALEKFATRVIADDASYPATSLKAVAIALNYFDGANNIKNALMGDMFVKDPGYRLVLNVVMTIFTKLLQKNLYWLRFPKKNQVSKC
jgi:hypothetical protein